MIMMVPNSNNNKKSIKERWREMFHNHHSGWNSIARHQHIWLDGGRANNKKKKLNKINICRNYVLIMCVPWIWDINKKKKNFCWIYNVLNRLRLTRNHLLKCFAHLIFNFVKFVGKNLRSIIIAGGSLK